MFYGPGLAHHKLAMTLIGLQHRALVAFFYGVAFISSLGLRANAAPPANDHFTNAIPLTGIISVSATNVGATAELGEPAHADVPAARSMWWKWSPTLAATYSIVTTNNLATNGLKLDTTLAVYTGNSVSKLTRVVANDDTDFGEFGATWSRAVFRAYPGETLFIAVDSIDASGSFRLNINLAGPIAQPWQATNLFGEPLLSSTFIGQVVMVDFWETICGACVEELPDLIRVQNALRPRGFTFVGLSGDHDPVVVRDYVGDSSINYPIAMKNSAVETILAGGPVGYPTKILLDPEGRIVGRYLGGHPEAYYRSLIEPLLRPSPPVRLSVVRAQGGVRLSWPGWQSGYRIETSSDLSGRLWSSNDIRPTISNSQYNLTLSNSHAAQFFRLAKP